MTVEKETEKKGLTTKALIIGAVLCIILSFEFAAHNGQLDTRNYYWQTGKGEIFHRGGGWAVIIGLGYLTLVAMALAVINKIKPVFSKQEIAVILIMVLAAGFTYGFVDFGAGGNVTAAFLTPPFGVYYKDVYNIDLANKFKSFYPSFLTLGDPTDPNVFAYWDAAYYTWKGSGWSNVNWGIVLPATLWGAGLTICLALAVIMLTVLLKPLHVDAEALPFPLATIIADVGLSSEPNRTSLWKNKLFLLGFLVTFIYYGAQWVPYTWYRILIEHRQELTGYAGLTPDGIRWNYLGLWDLCPLALLPWAVVYINTDIWQIAWGTMLTTDVLIGFVVTSVFLWILLPPILSGAGILPPFTQGNGIWYVSPRLSYYALGGFPTLNYISLAAGMIIGLAVIPMIQNRRTLMPILKSIIKEPGSEVSGSRPMPFRTAWLLFIVFFVLSWVFAAAAQIHLWLWIPSLILAIILMIGSLRLVFESGGLYGALFGDPTHFNMPSYIASVALVIFGGLGIVNSGQLSQANVFTLFALMMFSPIFFIVLQSSLLAGGSQKVGQLTNTRSKDMLRSSIIGIVIAILISSIFWLVWLILLPNLLIGPVEDIPGITAAFSSFVTGLQNKQLLSAGWSGDGVYQYTTLLTTYPMDSLIKFIIGMAIVAIIPYLRMKWSWFRISAAGIALGIVWGDWMWSTFLIALIIKVITLRVGGFKLYNEKLRPLALGLFIGIFPAMILLWQWAMWPNLLWFRPWPSA
jgi:hypothetical protein